MSSNRIRRRLLWAEKLESRAMLAGNVTASVSGGVLVVRGDGADNGIAITQVGFDSYAVIGFDLDGESTEVNGELEAQVFDNVNSLKVDLRGGDDIVLVGNDLEAGAALVLEATGEEIVLDLGDIELGDVDPVQAEFDGRINIRTGDGDDLVGVSAEAEFVGIVTGDGEDDVAVIGTDVDGLLKVQTGDEGDGVLIEGGSANRAIVHLGSGENGLAVAGIALDDDLIVSAGGGADAIEVSFIEEADSVIIKAGAGGNSVAVNDLILEGNLIVSGGGGGDGIGISAIEATDVIVNTFGGEDTITVGGLLLSDDLVINAGSAIDAIDVGSATIGGSATVLAGSGEDVVALADMSVEETFTFNAGSGDDTEISISGITDVDAFFAFLGSGDDSMEIADISALSGTFSGGSGSDVYIDGGGIEIDNLTETSISVEI